MAVSCMNEDFLVYSTIKLKCFVTFCNMLLLNIVSMLMLILIRQTVRFMLLSVFVVADS